MLILVINYDLGNSLKLNDMLEDTSLLLAIKIHVVIKTIRANIIV